MSMFFPVGDDMPEQLKSAIAQAIDHHNMHHESSHLEIMRLFDELSKDGLRTLTQIFTLLGRADPGLVHYFEGLGVAHMTLKFGVCVSCGEDHDAQLNADNAPTTAGSFADTEKQAPADQDAMSQAVSYALTASNLEALFKEYNVQPTQQYPQVACGNCGQPYSSLEDRMLKKPGDCSGCHQKAKWG